jgi:hypothetical protein
MRALGPGSVASLLKIALDCAYVALWLVIVALVVAMLGAPLVMPFVQGGRGLLNVLGRAENVGLVLRRWPAVEAFLFSSALYMGALAVITNRLRRVFETLTQGDPFRPENVGRLRIVGASLIALEVVGYLIRMSVVWLAPESVGAIRFSINLSGWFAILAVFVLAEVFREGARLRSDAELTI